MRGGWRFWMMLPALVVVSEAVLAPQSTTAAPPTSGDLQIFRTIARQQNPTVVAITTTRRESWPDVEDAEWFERFFGRTLPKGPRLRREIGSGFFINREGDILTNDHVIADAEVIEVRLLGRETTTYHARVVGRDPVSDSAVIRLKDGPRDLPWAALGDSDALEPGDWVIAIGNPFQLGHTVTAGVVSYLGRSFEVADGRWLKLIQTDASINPGSSGGPLLNLRGEVVGINVATLSDGLGETMGIGFAVPINTVKAVLPQLRIGNVPRGHLGVRLRLAVITDRDAAALGLPAARGALVTAVDESSLAMLAGIRAGDVVIDVAGVPIASADDLLSEISARAPGGHVAMTVLRDGQARTLTVELDRFEIETPQATETSDTPSDFGLTLSDITTSAGGAVVQRVRENSDAARAGLEKGDVVQKVNRQTIRSGADVMRELQHLQVGSGSAFVLVWREGRELLIEIQRN